MTQINAYLSFNGNCREAMTFYKECLGGELTIQSVEGSPAEKQMPPEMKNKVLHSSLNKDGLVLLASDLSPKALVNGNTITLCVNCSSDEEIHTFFSNLSAGGKVTDELSVKFWGDTFGGLTDKFGMNWIFNYHKN
jgi:PhnB protein